MDVGFQGYARQGVARIVLLSASNPSTGAVEVPDAAPTFRLYGPAGILLNGTTTPALNGSVTGATNATPIVITSVAHGLQTGNIVTVASVGGNTAANGTFAITRLTADTFSLNGSVGNGAYTAGGTWQTTGLHKVTLSASDTNGMTPGETYSLELSWAVSTALRKLSASLGCN